MIDGIVPEPGEGAHTDPDNAAEALGLVLRETLRELPKISPQQLIDERYEKFRRMGSFFTEPAVELDRMKKPMLIGIVISRRSWD